jgi:hypothetical protein
LVTLKSRMTQVKQSFQFLHKFVSDFVNCWQKRMLQNTSIFTNYGEIVFSHTNVPTSHMRAQMDQLLLQLVSLRNYLACPNDRISDS